MSAKRSLFSAVLQSVSINDEGGKGESKSNVHFGSPFETPTKDYSKWRSRFMLLGTIPSRVIAKLI